MTGSSIEMQGMPSRAQWSSSCAQRIVDNSEKHDTWLAFDFTQHALELAGSANESINVLQGLKIGVMGRSGSRHRIERLTRRI